MAGIHQTLKEARRLYAEAAKLQEAVLASHRDLKGFMAEWHESMESLMKQAKWVRGELKYMGRGFLALVLMLCIMAGLVGGFLAVMMFRLAGGTD